MDPISLAKLAEIVGGDLLAVSVGGQRVRHVSTHSDHVRSGSVFFAFSGANTDGHKYVERALANGAVAAVVERCQVKSLPAELKALVVVEQPLHALRELAKWWRSNLSATFVAVVGNIGKTVTKDALVHFLGYTKPVYGSPGSYNSQIGVPLSILECPKNSQIAVIEAANTEPGEMLRLAEIIRPNHVVLTNFGSRFESNFEHAVEYAREIVRVADGLSETGWLLIGEVDSTLISVVESLRATKYFEGNSDSLPSFSEAEYQADGISLLASFPDGGLGALNVRTPSERIVADVKLAISAAWLLGADSANLLDAARDYLPTSARMEVWRSPSGATVIRDVATTDGTTFTAAVRVAKRLTKPGNRTTVVLADTYDHCDDEAAFALGGTIGRASISELCTLRVPAHRAILHGVRTANPQLATQDFESAQEMREHLTSTLGAEDVVLIESPRDRMISELSLNLVEPIAPTRLYIDQSSIESNVTTFRRLVGPDVQLMAMVKALAYGTNPVQISICLETAGVDALAVATVDEGVALRRGGVSLPILVTLANEAEVDRIAGNALTPLIYSPHMLNAVLRYSELDVPPLDVHLEVDSGMHRTGFYPQDAISVLRELRTYPAVRLTGLMTHFACADMSIMDEFTLRQLSKFEEVVAAARDLGYNDVIRHAANTAATIRLPSTRLDMVRIGIGLFGIYPSEEIVPEVKLNPAISLCSEIVETIVLGHGEAVGYGATFRATGGARIGVVPAGYHDCIPRSFSNFSTVTVNGQSCPIVGNVSMDSMTIDITQCPDAVVGSDVVIYGRNSIRIEDVAAKIGTIPYELLARVGPRVQRVFTRH